MPNITMTKRGEEQRATEMMLWRTPMLGVETDNSCCQAHHQYVEDRHQARMIAERHLLRIGLPYEARELSPPKSWVKCCQAEMQA